MKHEFVMHHTMNKQQTMQQHGLIISNGNTIKYCNKV